ncbi:unnamed protein product [Brachionus calyciflorus]|uniref:Uncharacterized protein n=1 Tax=Brachionus calyciflorus TaxID=104777 RepID=A0A814HN62_9BILA|nr:unnamed protein product [Brachionus calyciflorus]
MNLNFLFVICCIFCIFYHVKARVVLEEPSYFGNVKFVPVRLGLIRSRPLKPNVASNRGQLVSAPIRSRPLKTYVAPNRAKAVSNVPVVPARFQLVSLGARPGSIVARSI